jgi:alkylation response protein AidB-like acyl-CoA dehydrogenase
MDFQSSEEQTLLTDSVGKFADKQYDFEARKHIVASPAGYSPDVWKQFAEMGLLGIPIAAEHGGFGGGAVDLIGVMQAFGQALVVEPYLATVVLGAGIVGRAGSDAQKTEMLPAVADGTLMLALAHSEAGARYRTGWVAARARRDGASWVLSGRKTAVLGAPQADRIVVSARTSGADGDATGISLFVVDRSAAGVSMSTYRTLDDLRAADLTLSEVRVPAGALLGSEGQALAAIEATLDFAAAVQCAEAIGAMADANRATLEYIKTRKQFGVAIGSFQALQHRMVDMTISAEQARSMTYLACTAVNGEQDARERARRVSAAKVKVSDACRHVSQEAVQLHGGMGMTQELKVSHTFRKLTMLARRFGDADHHLERFIALSD